MTATSDPRPGGSDTPAPPSLEPLLATKEIMVFCGSGGVGKTSVAAAAGLAAASRLGGKVLVVTVDPAKRLADALGVESIGNVERRVPEAAFTGAGLEPRGELWAAMLDTKQSWDAIVMRHAPDEATAYRILDNRLYDNLTSRFVQSHDYVAMERLFEIHQSGRYDLILVDTPPTRNALDFLDAPARMAEFFGGRLLRWLTAPYRVGGKRGARMISIASRPFYQVADRLLGSQFLQDIAEFFLNFQSMYDGFVARSRAVEALLHDKRTSFAVVTTLEDAPLREGERFCDELVRREFHLGALVLNKTLPQALFSPEAMRSAQALRRDATATAAELGLAADVDNVARVLTTIGASFENYAVVARREAELRHELAHRPDVVVDVPTFADEISDLTSLARIADRLMPH
ncbi:MAG: ArsA family ATPase [Acidimicrobiia bacterium]|nr:ArsA family ATPase [Acidimicrobiia bacterium]